MVISSYPLVDRDASAGFEGPRFYRPGVVMGYCLLNLPLGLVLLGLNEARRGHRLAGYSLAGLAATAAQVLLVSAAMGSPLGSLGMFSVCIAMSIYLKESDAQRVARSKGGHDARWWPPLLWLLTGMTASLLAVAAVAALANR